MTRTLIAALAVLTALGGCRLTLGAATDIGLANVGTAISVDPRTGDVDQTLGASVTIH